MQPQVRGGCCQLRLPMMHTCGCPFKSTDSLAWCSPAGCVSTEASIPAVTPPAAKAWFGLQPRASRLSRSTGHTPR